MRAEAVGAVILAAHLSVTLPADIVMPDQCRFLAVLAGSAVNQDGRSSSLTAPNGPSQQEVINSAVRSADLSALDVSLLQMHGTGTPLGDPIEVGAATASFLRRGEKRTSPLFLTAAKSFMGHAEPAAGIVGIIQVASNVRQQDVDPIISLRYVNPYVGAAIAVSAQHGPMHRTFAPRQLGPAPSAWTSAIGSVSSFAFQGTNAHAVVLNIQKSYDSVGVLGARWMTEAAIAARMRFWVLPHAHPFASGVSKPSERAMGNHIALQANLNAARVAVFSDHSVFGRVLFPAAGMLEAGLAAGSILVDHDSALTVTVAKMTIANPLVIPANVPSGGIILSCLLNPGDGTFKLSHRQLETPSQENAEGSYTHARLFGDRQYQKATAAAAIRHLFAVYDVVTLNSHGNAVGGIAVDPRTVSDGYLVPPPCLDACLHLGVAVPGCGAKVPVAIGAFCKLVRKVSDAYQHFSGTTSVPYMIPDSLMDVSSFGIDTENQSKLASLNHLTTKVMKFKASEQAGETMAAADFVYEVQWDKVAYPADFVPGTSPLSSAAATLRLLKEAEYALSVVTVMDGKSVASVVATALQVVQAMPGSQIKSMTAAVEDTVDNTSVLRLARISLAAVEGALRVAATEFAATSFSLAATSPFSVGQLRNLGRLKGVLSTMRQRAGASAYPQLSRSRAVLPSQALLQIRPMPRGSLQSLKPLPFKSGPPGPGHVLVSVKSVGINFRDLLNILGMYPGDPGPPGSDFAGVITAVGDDVNHVQPGNNISELCPVYA